MNNANYRAQISDLLDEWVDNSKQAKNIINCLVEFLTADMYWLNQHISEDDRETLILALNRATRANHMLSNSDDQQRRSNILSILQFLQRTTEGDQNE